MSQRSDKELVHDAYLEVKFDPEKYSPWQKVFIEDVESRFKNDQQTTLTEKQKLIVRKILEE